MFKRKKVVLIGSHCRAFFSVTSECIISKADILFNYEFELLQNELSSYWVSIEVFWHKDCNKIFMIVGASKFTSILFFAPYFRTGKFSALGENFKLEKEVKQWLISCHLHTYWLHCFVLLFHLFASSRTWRTDRILYF